MNREANEPIKNRRVFRLGDTVQIAAGPFANFEGKIDGINQAKALVKVKVTIFGRTTPVKLSFSEVRNLPTP
jgi:transcriptional antiterminator NusG